MADHIWFQKGNCLPLLDEVKIIDGEERWRLSLKEAVHMLGCSDLLRRPSIEIIMIMEPLIKKKNLEKKMIVI